MCRRALERETFGAPVATRGNVLDWIAESRIEIEMARLLTLKTAWLMDTVGNKHARTEIAAIKVAAPNVALKVIDRAIQVHGGARRLRGLPAGLGLRAHAHAAPRRRPRRGAQAVDRAARAAAVPAQNAVHRTDDDPPERLRVSGPRTAPAGSPGTRGRQWRFVLKLVQNLSRTLVQAATRPLSDF